jgi:hypothetical protein
MRHMVGIDDGMWKAVDRRRRVRFGRKEPWIEALRTVVAAGLNVPKDEIAIIDAPLPELLPVVPMPPEPVVEAPAKRPKAEKEKGPSGWDLVGEIESAVADPRRFIVGDRTTLTKGQVMNLHRLAKKYPKDVWARVGRYLKVSATTWRGERLLSPAWVSTGFEDAVAKSLVWEERGDTLSPHARAMLAACEATSGGRFVSWDARTVGPDALAVIDGLTRQFTGVEWKRLGEWMASGGLSWMKEPTVPLRLFVAHGRDWFGRALATHRPQQAVRVEGPRLSGSELLAARMRGMNGTEVSNGDGEGADLFGGGGHVGGNGRDARGA